MACTITDEERRCVCLLTAPNVRALRQEAILMLQAPEILRELLNELLDTLDDAGDEDGSTSSPSDRRLQLRRAFRTECAVMCFTPGMPMRTLAGMTRNISFRGLSVLVPTQLYKGHPVEIRVDLPDQDPTHLAGVVVFCRKVRRGYHEVGLRLHAGGSQPTLGEATTSNTSSSDWLAEALAKVKQIALDQE